MSDQAVFLLACMSKFNEYCHWNNTVDESELSSTHHLLQAALDFEDVSK